MPAATIDGKAEGLGGGLVLVRVVDEAERARRVLRIGRAIEVPAREHPRRGVDVVFRVVPDPAREQLHQLAAEVFLRLGLGIGVAVQPDQHCRVLSEGDQQIAQAAQRAVAQQLDLAALLRRILGRFRRHQPRTVLRFDPARRDLRNAGREVVVPEERHLLLQRTVRVHHPEQPSLSRIVGDRVGGEGALRCRAEIPGFAEVGVDGIGDRVVVDQPIDGRRVRQLGVGGEFRAAAAKPRAPQEMFDQRVAGGHVWAPSLLCPLDRPCLRK